MHASFARRFAPLLAPLLATILSLPALAPTPSAAAAVSATLRPAGAPEVVIYSDDFAYVRDPRRVSLVAGDNEVLLEGMPQRLDSTSVRLEGPGLDVREQSFRYDLWSGDKVFRHYLGDSIFFRWMNRPTRGVLEGIDGDELFIRRSDSTDVLLIVRRAQIQEVEFPARKGSVGLATRPSLRWRIRAAKSGESPALLTYLTGALGWTADYAATLEHDERSISLSGLASIWNRSGAAYENARVSLVAGEIHRAGTSVDRGTMELEGSGEPAGGKPQGLFAYHLYPVGDPVDLPAWGSLQVPIVQAAKVAAARAYRYDGARDGSKVRAQVVFANDKASGLGIPLPAGRVRVFAADASAGGAGAVALVGEDALEATPAGERVTLDCGIAFDLTGERTRTAHTRAARNVTDDQFEIRLRNAGATEAKITVAETLYGTWEITQKSAPFRKKSAEAIEFDVAVPARGESVVTYTVRTTY
jgi:hypothetical protein